ncbi:MAG: DUF1203 domain-containing protein [Nocardioidaceae bacterium]
MSSPTTYRTHHEDRPAKAAATTPAFRVEAIASDHLDRIRAAGRDDFGNPFDVTVDVDGGSPLRCCLRPTEPGERIALIAHSPSPGPGPYAEVGPVFVHAEACRGYQTPAQYPPGYRDWAPMIFRPYDASGAMVYPALAMVEAEHAERVIATMLADPGIELIHARNVYAGCFMFTIHRQPALAESERQLDLSDGAGGGADRGLDGG